MPSARPGTDDVTPKRPLDGRTSGSVRSGTPRSSHISLLHVIVRMSNSIVRLALLGSVANSRPPVSFQTSHASTVPMAWPAMVTARPSATSEETLKRASSGALLASSQAAFVPEK